MKTMLLRLFEHVKVNMRIFMAREPDITNLPRLPGFEESLHGAGLRKDTARVREEKDFVMLQQIDVVHLKALQRFVKLLRCLLFRAAIELGHHKRLLAIT